MTDEDMKPRPAVGHMPFKGHRTVAAVWASEKAKKRCNEPEYREKRRGEYHARLARQYGRER